MSDASAPSEATNAGPEATDEQIRTAAAQAAAGTPGVARLAPYVLGAARTAVSSTAKRVSSRFAGREDDLSPPAGPTVRPDAVELEHRPDGTTAVTVRIVARTEPPVKHVVREVAQRVTGRLDAATGGNVAVTVTVVDVEV